MNNNTDPLSVLHGDELPVQPDPAFAARLRTRLESAVSLPNRTQGVVMSGTDTAIADLSQPATESAAAPPRPAALPYLTVANAREAIAWYAETFGAAVVGETYEMDDGRIGHAELAIGNGVLYLADEYPEIGLKAPAPQATSVSLMLHVADTDATLERARQRGAQVHGEPVENYGARNATLIDPFGHRWMLSGPSTGAMTPIHHGDVGYVSVWTPDADRAAAFYGHVLGWTYDPTTHQVTNTKQHIGLFSVASPQGMLCCYAVADLAGARQSIVEGGGHVGEVQEFDFGPVLDCHRPRRHGVRRVPAGAGDSTARRFSTALGQASFRTSPMEVAGLRPRSGRSTGQDTVLGCSSRAASTTDGRFREPIRWRALPAAVTQHVTSCRCGPVEDVDAAVARVREAGGTVIEEPSQQGAYGRVGAVHRRPGHPLLPRRVLIAISARYPSVPSLPGWL